MSVQDTGKSTLLTVYTGKSTLDSVQDLGTLDCGHLIQPKLLRYKLQVSILFQHKHSNH